MSDLIDSWLNERQTMLVLYCSMTGVDQQRDDTRPLQEKIRDFCQLLVDYVSAGHFEIYEQLEQEALDFGDERALSSSQRLFKAIQKNTGLCLDFNDNCERLGSIAELQATLSMIGETLEERFALEDQLIAMLHHTHKGDVGQLAKA